MRDFEIISPYYIKQLNTCYVYNLQWLCEKFSRLVKLRFDAKIKWKYVACLHNHFLLVDKVLVALKESVDDYENRWRWDCLDSERQATDLSTSINCLFSSNILLDKLLQTFMKGAISALHKLSMHSFVSIRIN